MHSPVQEEGAHLSTRTKKLFGGISEPMTEVTVAPGTPEDDNARCKEPCTAQCKKKVPTSAQEQKDNIDAGRESLIKGLSAIEKMTVVIYVTRETSGSDFSDVGIIIESVVVLQDLDNVALATAMLFGLFYSLNLSYLSQLRYTFEVIQKVVMELDATQFSR